MSDIIGISRLRMGIDGEGITTLVVFYGCPLNCKYCINSHCKNKNTLKAFYTPNALYSEVSIDNLYFKMTKGGIAFGGGEPLLNSQFIHEFCGLVKKQWNIYIETSLNVEWKYIETIIGDIDKWYIDLKDTNPEIYKKYTGCENKKVMDNYKKLLNRVGKSKLHIRLPCIVNFNTDSDIERSKSLLKDEIDEIEVFDYIQC